MNPIQHTVLWNAPILYSDHYHVSLARTFPHSGGSDAPLSPPPLCRQDGKFVVERGALAFSVAMYTGCATLCVALLIARRYLKVFGPGELGGQWLGGGLTEGGLVNGAGGGLVCGIF